METLQPLTVLLAAEPTDWEALSWSSQRLVRLLSQPIQLASKITKESPRPAPLDRNLIEARHDIQMLHAAIVQKNRTTSMEHLRFAQSHLADALAD